MAEHTVPRGHVDGFRRQRALVALEWGKPEPSQQSPTALLETVKVQLNAYFDGKLKKFSLPLAPTGTDFQRRVWTAMAEIPYGHTRTYGELAQTIGGVARAVGGACGKNPIPIILPCHRVMGGGGKLTGFSGGAGPESKVFLLKLEGAMFL